MARSSTIEDRVAELLAAEAAGSMDREERAELDSVRSPHDALVRDEMLAAATLAQLSFVKNDRPAHRQLPDALRQRLRQQGAAWIAGRQVGDGLARRRRRADIGTVNHRPVSRWFSPAAAGWYVAAALAVIVSALRPLPDAGVVPADATLEAERTALVNEAADLVTVAWGRSAEPGYENAGGDVVWSDARQEGYLRIAGLPVNDRSRAQYQLWVVDASRDVHPVDGGVFDITSDGELIIPVQAKLALRRPTAFAVTLEKPGGVVVSDGPMLLVASVGG